MDKKQMKVCVTLSKPRSNLYIELAEAILDGLSALGFLPALVRDGDRDVFEVDALLLLGDSTGFDGFAELLAHHKGSRPTTILWQLEPLPPPTLNERAERIGLRASDIMEWVTLPPGILSRLIKSVVPLSVRTKVREAINGALFSGFDKELVRNSKHELMGLDAYARLNMMRQYDRLKSRLLEGWIDHLFVQNVSKKEFLESRGIQAERVPIGHHTLMGENLGMERDVDVVFLGALDTPLRRKILGNLQTSLASKGISLLTVGQGCFGKERTELFNRARISLSLASHPNDLPSIRFLMSMSCGALVVSDPLYDPKPFKAGEHFVQAGVADLPEVIAYYLAKEAERKAIVRSANHFVTRELTMQESMKQIMGALSANSAVSTGNLRRGD
jgi:hypothetical protein